MLGQIDKEESDATDDDLLEEVMQIDKDSHTSGLRDKILYNLLVNNKKITFEVDTGAPVTIISVADAIKHFGRNVKIHNSDLQLYSYCKTPINCVGYIWVTVKTATATKVKLYVVRSDRKPLLGREWLRSVQLDWHKMLKSKFKSEEVVNQIQDQVEREGQLKEILEKYPNLFSPSTGKISGFKARLYVKPNAVPRSIKARRVAFPLLQAVEQELESQVRDGLLVKVDRSEWATPIVVVRKKDDKVRLCGDYKVTVNPELVVDEHPLPTIDELFSTMAGGKTFSKIDLSKAYLQLEVHPDDQHLLTLNTHKGLYRPTRLMFGIACAPSQWQRFMENLLADIEGVKVFLDDIKITAGDDKLHLERLNEVLRRLDKHNMRVNLEKSEFLQSRIEYCGYIIDKEGIRKMPAKIQAIQNMKQPTNKDEVRSFLGLVNYYGRFIKNLSTIVYPLNQLLHNEVPFNFDARCKTAFVEVKKQIQSDVVLTYYDPKLPITLAVDASTTGVGAVLSHEFREGSEKPIQFASRTLNQTQQRYSQVDKEAYAIIFGVRKFYQYLYGRQFTLITDNKAVSQIFSPNKGLPILSATRMQHYAVYLESFNYKIRLRKSSENANADALSRLPAAKTRKQGRSEVDQIETELIENLPVTVKELSAATKNDKEVKNLIESLKYGRKCEPDHCFGVDQAEFTLQRGCLLRGVRVYVPKPLRPQVLTELHTGHFGISKMKALGRAYCWWKDLDRDIEKLVSNCRECQSTRRNPKKELVHCWLAPSKVFERVHVDYAGPFLGKYFFVLVDAFSKWPEVRIVSDMTTESTIKVCRNIFATLGIPNVLVSDNGPQFKSDEFGKFLKQNGIIHKTGAPYHPETNGQAERFIQTFKNKLKAVNSRPKELQKNLDQILLAYRRAIHPAINKSPAMILFGRQIQSRLDLLLPNSTVGDGERQLAKKKFKVGEKVSVREYTGSDRWQFGVIEERIGELHYTVKLEDGRIWRRHVDQILKADVAQVPKRYDATSVVEDIAPVHPEVSVRIAEGGDECLESPICAPITDGPERNEATTTQRPQRNRNPPKHLLDYELDS